MNDILKGYAKAATPELIARYNALDCAEVYAPVLDLLPTTPSRIADIGAGTGRDAAWFAAKGHTVLAVEPVKELRDAGIRQHTSAQIEWLDDSLPGLEKARGHEPFDMITLCGVWQHINEASRPLAMANLAGMIKPYGLLVMSLRHGPAPADRAVFPITPDDTINSAEGLGFNLIRRIETGSIQAGNVALGVHWTWLALQMGLPCK
jgi:SAM-dependent methyltransferase